MLGLYASLLSIGFGVGPALLAVLGTGGWAPFLAGAACSTAAVVPLLLVRASLPEAPAGAAVSARAFAPLAPLLLVSVAATAFAEQAILSLLPVWAVQRELAEATASLMLVVLVAGSAVLMPPVGWMADRLPRAVPAAACAALTAVCAALLPLAGEGDAVLWPLLFVWGGAYYGIYTVSLVRLGQRFAGQLLVAGTAAFGAVWGLGGAIGPPVVGASIDLLGTTGLPITLAALFAALAPVLARSPV